MPRYRFSVRDQDHIDDEDDVILADDVAARKYAFRVMHELQKGDEAAWSGYMMQVTRDGQVVWEIPFELSFKPINLL